MGQLTRMTIEEVHNYMEQNGVEVFESFTDEDGDVYWGFAGNSGFSTFDMCGLDEDKAKYAAVLFYRLVNEYGICFGDAEMFAGSYVKTYKVMQKPMTEEEQEEIRQRTITALKEGNVIDCRDNVNIVGEEGDNDHYDIGGEG